MITRSPGSTCTPRCSHTGPVAQQQRDAVGGIVRQRQVGLNTKSFPNALKAALREDPNIILVGEMRDLETIRLALTAAETGHLVFGTLHTSSAAKTIDRIIDVFPPYQQPQIRMQLSMSLLAIVSQRLLPRADEPALACYCGRAGCVPA